MLSVLFPGCLLPTSPISAGTFAPLFLLAPNIDLQPFLFQTNGQFVFPLSPFHAPHTVETSTKPKDSGFRGDSEALCALKGGVAPPSGSGVKQLIWPPGESEAVCGVTSTRWRLGKPSVLCSRDKFGE